MILDPLADLLWPPRCAACDRPVAPAATLCPPCAETLLACPGDPQKLSFPRSAAWDTAICCFEFGGQVAAAIRRAKYESALARQLGRLLLPLPAADLVVPVPLHRRRLRARGFNQAAELIRGAGARPALSCLARIRDTPSQTDRPPPARLANVSGAFAARNVLGARVLLVDDVITTGATADACARAIRQAGAAAVAVLALARAQA